MIIFPDISPEIFSFSIFGVNLALRWYALSYIAGFICALQIMKFFVPFEVYHSSMSISAGQSILRDKILNASPLGKNSSSSN